MPRLLVVDDEAGVCYSFRRLFGSDTVEVVTAQSLAEGRALLQSHPPDVVVLDLQLPDGSGMDLFEDIRARTPRRPVIFITAHGTTGTAIEAMKNGAFDYLIKPLDVEPLSELIRRAFEAAQLMAVPAVLPGLEPREPLVGRSPVMQEMCKLIGRVAPQDVNVLITGESGVGKELVARALYHHSRRADKPFLAINCPALPEALVESELFGHEAGAFTGADRKRIGKFEQCRGGTIFLDEIGDMPLAAQAKILRVLQEQRFERVGGNETVQTQVRVLAATNQDLEERIADGRFRRDLYYRLRVVRIGVPALRERGGDVAELAHHFLFLYNREFGLGYHGFDPEALACLQAYRWPGNVRELQGVLKEAMLRGAGPLLLPGALPPAVVRGEPAPAPAEGEPAGLGVQRLIEELLRAGETDLYDKVVQKVERALFARILQETKGHLGHASERLGLNRSTLRYKLRDLGLSVERVVGDEGGDAPARPHP
jgi:two-component system nitrogen regulation response regulator GlnG